MTTSDVFKSLQAPCGKIVDAQSYQDRDDEVIVTRGVDYACGCSSVEHEYHDGSISKRVTRHDGVVLVDEMLSAE